MSILLCVAFDHAGMGNYNGRATFETFSHRKSVLDKATFPDPSLRYPPYTEKKVRVRGLRVVSLACSTLCSLLRCVG